MDPRDGLVFCEFTLFQHEVKGLAVVGYVDPVSDLFSISVDWDFQVEYCSHDCFWDELFWELVWSEVIGASGDDGFQAVGFTISSDVQVCGCF